MPSVARGVLARLAALQATHFDPVNDAEPGKIVHETRSGEMARLREVPFGCYYGSVDATPLFVLLAGEYWQRSDRHRGRSGTSGRTSVLRSTGSTSTRWRT